MCYERHLTPSERRANMLSIKNTLQCGSELPHHCVPGVRHRVWDSGPLVLASVGASGRAEAAVCVVSVVGGQRGGWAGMERLGGKTLRLHSWGSRELRKGGASWRLREAGANFENSYYFF